MRRTLQWFFIFLFLLAVGIASGSFFEVFLYGSGKDSLAETLNIFTAGNAQSISAFPASNMLKNNHNRRTSPDCTFHTPSYALFSTDHFCKGIQLRLHCLHDV